MIDRPKKERRFLKALGRVGEILIQEVLIKIGSNLIKKIGGKKTLPSILFLLASLSLFAQYPNTGNKQRLGFQTTGDGLTWRGSLSDTATIQPINNQNAWVILDTVNLKIYSFDFTSNTWNLVGGGSTIDTASLSNRINLKLNISDTAAMLLPYAKKSYVDTAGRFYARQDFSNVTTSTLTWTQTDTLIPAGVNVVQVYRNGQILLPSQYTIPTSTSVIIAATSFKVGENYTVIFPKGGGGSGGGSGSLTSISGGTGITVSPDPITTTGTVSADLSVLMELTDTSLLNLTSRFAAKQNTLVSGTNIKTVNSNSLLGSGNISVGTLVAADTISLSNRINAKDTGTVTSVATGYGLSGGTITSTGTLVLDSAVVFSRIRDSIVDVAIGNDTIKILKQEYAPATTSVLTWTITPKFPIQLKTYILVFRNGQLLINDQYNLTDTNKITIVSNSFKVGANYTVVTVSGIGSVGTGTFPNPVYPEAGIAVSTGTTWTTSIPNNSSNWNIAFNDKITNAAFSGTNTKTLTLTQYDGGTFAPTFDDLQGIVAADTSSMLTNYLRSGVAALTYQTILTNPITGTGTTNTLPLFTGSSTLGNSVIQESSGNIGIGTTPTSNLELARGKFITLNSRESGFPEDSSGIMIYETGTKTATDINFGAKIMYNSVSDNFEIKMKNDNGTTLFNPPVSISIPRGTGVVNIGTSLAVTGAITEGGNNVLTNLDTASLSSRIDLKLNKTDTASLSSRIDLKLNKTDTASLSNRINNKVSLTGDEYINGQKTFGGLIIPSNGMQLTATGNNSNKLIGINASSFVGEVTLGTGLTLTSNVLNATEKYYFDLGIVAGAADNSAATYDFTYGSNIFIVPTSLNGYCIDSVYIRAIGCSTCPPVAGDKDYYVGVYKANAGARVATSGATLVGSQITMNEYDLNEVNRNDTLSTGEAWWVYLNGTYTSDLAYVTAGFIVKKTCN